MQWLQGPNQNNVDNLNNIRCEASRHLRNKKKAYLRAKFDEFETNSKIKNIRDLYRGISDFKKGHQPRTNIEKMRRLIWLQTPTEYKIYNSASERVEQFRYLGTTLTNQNSIQEEIKSRLKSGNACCHSLQYLLSSSLLSKNVKLKIYRNIISPVVLWVFNLVAHIGGGM